MCGHVGVAGDLNRNAMQAFKDLLFMDTLRGPHGTGVALVPFAKSQRTADEITVMKMPIAAPEFLKNEAVKSELGSVTHGVVIGHNRHATLGKHTYENTHPFQEGNIVGAHNGTVAGRNRTDLELEGDWGTDSQEIMANINAYGIENVIPKLANGQNTSTDGAWCFIWYDVAENTLNFIRNQHRPLFFTFNEEQDQIFWASEAYMLHAACARRGVKIGKVFSLPVDTLYSWAVPSYNEKFQDKPETTPLKGKAVRVFTTSQGSYGGRWNKETRSWDNPVDTTKNITGPSSSINTQKGKVIPFLGASLDQPLEPYDLTESQMTTVFSKGCESCAYCQASVEKKDITDGEAIALSPDTVVCGDCVMDVQKNIAANGYSKG